MLHIRLVLAAAISLAAAPDAWPAERRNEVSFLRGPYNIELFKRHNTAFRVSAAMHFSHSKQHDVLLLTPAGKAAQVDAAFDGESVAFAKALRAKTEPTQELYAPYMARVAWKALRAIDWTHMHHEQTYDIMADRDIPWAEKKRWTDRSLAYYLANDVAFSPAPLDVTMRRAAVMMKPYFTLFRNLYPRSNDFFYAAHWWHPALYEAQMVGGNGAGQESAVRGTIETFYAQVLPERPQRMLLLREVAPRYSRLSPESANVFDNLHMFHGITYDILAYEGWTPDEKRAEIYRVIDALRYQPGDEQLARKFAVPRPETDPRRYEAWMKGTEGEMNRIMLEMMAEMMPMIMPHGMDGVLHQKMMQQLRLKLKPGMDEGESAGSLHDAMMKMMPAMKMAPQSMQPGATPQAMVTTMLEGWRKKHGSMADIAPMPMQEEPRS